MAAGPDGRPTFPLANILELPDGRLAEWEASGDGPPLLWIEGGPGLPAHLARPEAALLADTFRVHLVNPPGSGRSTPPATPKGYSLEAHVRYFEDVRAALRLGAITVMGHSWGGLVALAFALALPEAVERLVIVDGYAGDASLPQVDAIAEREQAFDRVRSAPWFDAAITAFDEDPATAPALDELFKACWPLYFADLSSPQSRLHNERLGRETRWNIDAVRAWDPEPPLNLLPRLGAISCPTLVIAGEHDFICGPAWNRPIADAIRGAAYVEIPGVGHLPQYEAPDQFRSSIIEWLTGP